MAEPTSVEPLSSVERSRDQIERSEIPLPGGNITPVTRSADTVRRASGPWTPTIHRLLAHLHDRGIDWLPEPLGTDEHGREVLSFLPGTVPNYPLPAEVWSDATLDSAGWMLRALHDATLDFDRSGALWQQPAREPAEVICHNDFAPYNFVFEGQRLTGVIDWDMASPGSRLWDLAYLAYRMVPLCSEPGDARARHRRPPCAPARGVRQRDDGRRGDRDRGAEAR